jgi:hypothetical protein
VSGRAAFGCRPAAAPALCVCVGRRQLGALVLDLRKRGKSAGQAGCILACKTGKVYYPVYLPRAGLSVARPRPREALRRAGCPRIPARPCLAVCGSLTAPHGAGLPSTALAG